MKIGNQKQSTATKLNTKLYEQHQFITNTLIVKLLEKYKSKPTWEIIGSFIIHFTKSQEKLYVSETPILNNKQDYNFDYPQD